MRFAVTPRQRWQLAQLFLHKDAKIEGVEELKRFNRTRLALKLAAPMTLLGDGKPASTDIVTSDALHGYELDEAAVDLLLGKIVPLQMNGFTAMVLGTFFEAVETAKLTKTAPEVEVPDPPAEERWAATDEELEEAKAKAAERERLTRAAAGN